MNRNLLESHGAILRAMRAASIAIVPEPQNGSQNASLYRQALIATSHAASVSLIGASPCSVRYHRLWSASPVISRSIRAVLSIMSISICNSSWFHGFPGILPYVSMIAFCPILWIVGTLERVDRADDPSMMSWRFGEMYSFQWIFAIRVYSVSKSSTIQDHRFR